MNAATATAFLGALDTRIDSVRIEGWKIVEMKLRSTHRDVLAEALAEEGVTLRTVYGDIPIVLANTSELVVTR